MVHQLFKTLKNSTVENGAVRRILGKLLRRLIRTCLCLLGNLLKLLAKNVLVTLGLPLFRKVQGEEKMSPVNSFSPAFSTKQLPKLSEFQFYPFCDTGVRCRGHTQWQSQITELEPRPFLKKVVFWSNLYETKFVKTSLIEMLELPNFGHITISAI